MVSTNLTGWKAGDQIATDQIEAKRKMLEAQGISLDMGFIQKLTQDAASAKRSLINLAAWKTEFGETGKGENYHRSEAVGSSWKNCDVAFRVRRKIDLGPIPQPQIEPTASATDRPSPLYRCPKCGGTMVIIQTLTAAQILLRSPPSSLPAA
jgi:hypothetical protein